MSNNDDTSPNHAPPSAVPSERSPSAVAPQPKEYGGPKGPEPTRYGDWEKGGRCIDF